MLSALLVCAGIVTATAATMTERYTLYVTRVINGRQVELVHDVYFSSKRAAEEYVWLRKLGLKPRIVAEVAVKE